ncbi:hypothetical protein QZL15_14460, partial [Acinetobacter baumannii]|nr:hypothetical protein [Acinetobacter baumannii]MDN8531633.1 hypothetical protein [Acinetobacter baumannii]
NTIRSKITHSLSHFYATSAVAHFIYGYSAISLFIGFTLHQKQKAVSVLTAFLIVLVTKI